MQFYEKFLALCNSNKVTQSKVCEDIGLDRASATFWKRGSKPRPTVQKKLADYFGVPFEYLSDDPEETEDATGTADNKKSAAESLRVEQRALLELTDGMTAEQINLMIQLARGLRGNR